MRIRSAVGAVLAVVGIVVWGRAAAPAAWQREGDRHTLACAGGVVVCEPGGRLSLRPVGQPALDASLFIWHGAWVYETLDGGRVETTEVLPDGTLRLAGAWGARDGAAPLRYTLALTPRADGVGVRLEVEKSGALKLADGVWASLSTAVAPDDRRRVYLQPVADAPVGKGVEGVFRQAFLGEEGGAAVCFQGEGLRPLRSRVSPSRHGFEVKFSKWRDLPAGEKGAVALAFGFAPMPPILRPAVTCAKPLSLSALAPAEVARGGKCEIEVALEGTWDNPYDPEQIALDAEVVTASGAAYTMPGFFMVRHRREREGVDDLMLPEGLGQWKVRLAATEPGPLRVTLTARDRSGRVRYALPRPIHVLENTKAKGRVRVSRADPHYLAFENGEGFFPIGHNVPIYQSSNAMSVQDILEKMAAHGENWNRWWLSRGGLGLEWESRLGWYRQAQAAKLDWLLEDAPRLGMYYMLCLDTHQDFREEGWLVNPYNAAQGGPCKTAGEWFTNEEAKAFYRKRLRYTVARWGYSPHVLCWEFGNEFEGWADAKQETIIGWHREMAPLLAALDPYDHLITTSWWSKTGPEACWRIPELDLVQTHSYANNDLNTALEARAFCLTQWEGFQKPHLFAEFGIRSHNFDPEADPTGRALHNTAWAALASGGCGAPMPWWHENYIEPKNLYFHFQALRSFVTGLPFGTERWRQVRVEGPPAVTVPARASRRDAVALTRSGFRKPAANLFTVTAEGTVAEDAELLALLHGGGHRDLVNPPTFLVTYPADGDFVIHVDKVSNGGLLKVFVDGELALERPLPCGEGCGKSWRYVPQWKLWESVYEEDVRVPVKAGARRIRVENHGKDWVSVSRYVFAGCRASERQEALCYALAAPGAAVAWIQNAESTWVNHARQADEIRPFPAASYRLEGFADGLYEVEWWETWHGTPLRRETVRAAGGWLTLQPGAVATDVAAKIRPAR